MMQTHAESKCDHDTSSRAILDFLLPHSVVRIDLATMLSYLKDAPNTKAANTDPGFHCLAVSWFREGIGVVMIVLGLALFTISVQPVTLILVSFGSIALLFAVSWYGGRSNQRSLP